MPKIAIIIPCHNEANRLSAKAFLHYLTTNDHAHFFFVNDGSTDSTPAIIENLKQSDPQRIHVLHLHANKGKSEAVRTGILDASRNSAYDYFGYLDADLSASLKEFGSLYEFMLKSNADFVSGSRVKMLNTRIDRSAFRHIAGRALATVIDSRYNLGIYDTQCGAKCFTRKIISVFDEPFHTKWFFDIEIFLRLRKIFPSMKAVEKPLNEWKEPGGSKLTAFSFPTITKEIITLFSNYRKY